MTNAPTTSLRDYSTAHISAPLLGRIAWYSIYELLVPHADLVAELTTLGLEEYKPVKPSDVDVFRRTMTALQRNRIEQGDETFVNVKVVNIVGDAKKVLKRVVIEHVDSKDELLDYVEAWNLTFDKITAQANREKLALVDTAADDLVRDAWVAFTRERGCVNSALLRNLVRNILEDNHAITVRPTGGVMFAPVGDPCATLAKIETLCTALDPSGKVLVLHSLPLPIEDGDKQTAMVHEAITRQSTDDLEALMAEAKTLLQLDEVPEAKATAIATRVRKVRERAEAYRALLSDDLEDTTTQLGLFDRQVAQLLAKAI